MINWIKEVGTGHCFFVLFPVCLILLFFLMKDRRKTFLISSLLMTLVIVNPVFYRYWTALGLYAYWRILWIVPVVPVVAAVIPAITERIEQMKQAAEDADHSDKPVKTTGMDRKWGVFAWKSIVTAAGVIAIVLGGTFLYSTANNPFRFPADNSAKLPADVVAVAERLLELKDNPRVILQDPLGIYIRQYSGRIDSLFGRDIHGFITWEPSINGKKIYSELCNTESDLSELAQFMLDESYDFLVMTDDNRINEDLELVDEVSGYGIYRALGLPSVIKEKNEKGQVLSVTFVDPDGQPINREKGYSTVLYSYDNYGDIVREYYINTDGEGVENENGSAGIERGVDYHGHLIMERTIDKNGNPTKANKLYAEIRWEYSGHNLISYSYYDELGKPVNNSSGFSIVKRRFDKNGNIISEIFLDADGNQVSLK